MMTFVERNTKSEYKKKKKIVADSDQISYVLSTIPV